MRHWLFKSTILFWVLLPAAFIPLVLRSSAISLWCGFGLGRPWHYGYYCEDHGVRIDSLAAFSGDFFIGFAAVFVLWLVAGRVFGKSKL